MKTFEMISPSTGVVFNIICQSGKYRIHLGRIPNDDKCSSYTTVYSKCIKKYNTVSSCDEWLKRFESKSEDDKQLYVARYLRGQGEQKEIKHSGGNFVIYWAVTKRLFIRRLNKRNEVTWNHFDTYTNPILLERAINRFRSRGHEVLTEDGVGRWVKVPKNQVNEAREMLILETKEEQEVMQLGVAKKVRGASFWRNK